MKAIKDCGPGGPSKMKKTMREWKAGELHSGSKEGPVVTDQRQAVAIGLSQLRKAGEGKRAGKKK